MTSSAITSKHGESVFFSKIVLQKRLQRVVEPEIIRFFIFLPPSQPQFCLFQQILPHFRHLPVLIILYKFPVADLLAELHCQLF